MQAAVEVTGLTKRYHDTAVVDGIDLVVERGEVVGILGANGAGKTTAVECIQGLRRADAGVVRVCGLDPFTDRAALTGRIGSQLQDSAMPDRIRVEEALGFFAGPDADPLEEVLSVWGLTDHRRTAFAALSGGQQQRLFIALALLNRPEVVFLDELTQGLDPHARRVVWSLVDQLRKAGTTILLVTHFLDEAEALCDRVAVMSAGQIIANGSPEELLGQFGGHSRVSFTAATPMDGQRFHDLPGCVSVENADGRITVTGDHETVAHACAALVEIGAIPSDLEIEQPSLEDALLPLIGDENTP